MFTAILLTILLFGIEVEGNLYESRDIDFADGNRKDHHVSNDIVVPEKDIELLRQEFEKMRMVNAVVLEISEATRQDIESLRQDLVTMKKENALLRQRVDGTKTENDILKQKFISVMDDIDMIQKENEDIKKDNIRGKMEIEILKSQIETILGDTRNSKDDTKMQIPIIKEHITTINYTETSQQSSKPDRTTSNEDALNNAVQFRPKRNGYSANDGIFDVPLSGVYVFTWSVADYHDWYAAELVVNGVSRGATVADNDSEDVAVGTAIVVVHVQAGSHVFVRRSMGGGCKVVNFDQSGKNSFSGWLIYPTEP